MYKMFSLHLLERCVSAGDFGHKPSISFIPVTQAFHDGIHLFAKQNSKSLVSFLASVVKYSGQGGFVLHTTGPLYCMNCKSKPAVGKSDYTTCTYVYSADINISTDTPERIL